MKRDSRLSDVLHVLLHMAEINSPVTSEILAKMLHTNPVVVRRVLATLREQGYVQSEKGHGGGWQLACDLDKVTLHDIYVALGQPTILAIGNRNEAPGCLVEQAVNSMMNESYRAAEALLLAQFSEVTLAALSQHVHQGVQARGGYSQQADSDRHKESDITMQPHHHPSHTHHGHHHFKGIDRWVSILDNPEREKKQFPNEVIAMLGIQDGDVVADIGAGTGYFAIRMAEAYPHVSVLAADVEAEMIAYLHTQATERNLANLEAVLLDPARPQLPVKATLALIVDVLHHIENRRAYLEILKGSLADGSRIAVIDYTEEAVEGPPADHRLPKQTLVQELHALGYALESDVQLLPQQYFLIFRQV